MLAVILLASSRVSSLAAERRPLRARKERPIDARCYSRRTYLNAGWRTWGDWLGTGTIAPGLRKYRSFKKARAFARTLDLKSNAEWLDYCASGKKPVDIPAAPQHRYAKVGWASWGDWLGTGIVAPSLRQYRSFRKARAFVRRLGLKSRSEWYDYCKSGKKPADIPAFPDQTYSHAGWAGMSDWLGTGTIAPRLRQYRSFKKARAFVRELGLQSSKDWRDYCASGKKPADIPANPDRAYADDGWSGMGDWLGTGTVATRSRQYRPFKRARTFVRRLGLKSRAYWSDYCRSGKKPDDIPTYPNETYAHSGWVGMGDWLGAGRIAPGQHRPFKKARAFVQRLGLKSQTKWHDYLKSGRKPADIPNAPQSVYANDGWAGYGDWLGTDTIATHFRRYRSFKKARTFVRGLGLKSQIEWKAYCKSGQKPDDIPSNANLVYANDGWAGMRDWLDG
jgi:hypothetical protein